MNRRTVLKIFAALLAFAMLFALASCGNKKKTNADPETENAPSSASASDAKNEDGKQKKPASEEPEEKGTEGEFVAPSGEIQLPIVTP